MDGKFEEWLGEPLFPEFVGRTLGVVGADVITEYLKKRFAGLRGVSDEIIQAILGFGSIKVLGKRHPFFIHFGQGILYELVARIIRERVVKAKKSEEPLAQEEGDLEELEKELTELEKEVGASKEPEAQKQAEELAEVEKELEKLEEEVGTSKASVDSYTSLEDYVAKKYKI